MNTASIRHNTTVKRKDSLKVHIFFEKCYLLLEKYFIADYINLDIWSFMSFKLLGRY